MEYYSIMSSELDAKDKEILEWLKSNSKMTVLQISKKMGIPPTTVHNRIKQLETNGIIKGYSIVVDKSKMGLPISVVILATIQYDHSRTKKFSQKEVAKQIKNIRGVESVEIVTGKIDMIVKANLESIQVLDEFILDKLRNIEGIGNTETLLVLTEFD